MLHVSRDWGTKTCITYRREVGIVPYKFSWFLERRVRLRADVRRQLELRGRRSPCPAWRRRRRQTTSDSRWGRTGIGIRSRHKARRGVDWRGRRCDRRSKPGRRGSDARWQERRWRERHARREEWWRTWNRWHSYTRRHRHRGETRRHHRGRPLNGVINLYAGKRRQTLTALAYQA